MAARFVVSWRFAALPPVLTLFSQRVLAAVMVRVGFLFTAIAVPSLFVTIVKRIVGRARPECRRQPRPVPLQSVQVGSGLCRHAVGTRHDGFRRACRRRDTFGRAHARPC